MGDEVGITFDGNVISLFIKNRRREQFRFKARKNLYGFVHVQGMHMNKTKQVLSGFKSKLLSFSVFN